MVCLVIVSVCSLPQGDKDIDNINEIDGFDDFDDVDDSVFELETTSRTTTTTTTTTTRAPYRPLRPNRPLASMVHTFLQTLESIISSAGYLANTFFGSVSNGINSSGKLMAENTGKLIENRATTSPPHPPSNIVSYRLK